MAGSSPENSAPLPGPTPRVLLSETFGTGALVAIVIGSGIMAETLSNGNFGLALLANTLATVFGLFVLIEVCAVHGLAHFNPIVSAVCVLQRQLSARSLPLIVAAQFCGAVLGCWLAHAMFELSLIQWSTKVRSGTGQWIGEAVATAGLILVVLTAPRTRVAACVALFIGSAYWFTSSTSFANPAVALGRMFSDTFAGIAPSSVPGFVVAQVLGGALGMFLARAWGSGRASAPSRSAS